MRTLLRAAVLSGAACVLLGETAVDSSHGWLLVANKGDRALGLINVEARRQVTESAEGDVTGHEVIASPDGKTAFVPIYGDSGVGRPGSNGDHIVAIDLAGRRIVGSVQFARGVRPHCPQFNPHDGFLYVTTELEKTVSVIDPKTLQVVGAIPTGAEQSHMLVLSKDGRWAYTANVEPGSVSVLNLATRKTVAVIPIAPVVQRITLSPDGKMLFTADQKQPRIAVVDVVKKSVQQWITLPSTAYGTAITSDGLTLIAALNQINQVALIDLRKFQVHSLIEVPASPQEVLIRPDQKEAYVSCDRSGKIAVIDLQQSQLSGAIDAGKGPDGLAWALR